MSSSHHLSRRDIENLKSSIDKVIYKCLGYTDSSILSAATSCLTNGYERRKIADKLSSIVDSKKASRLAEKISILAEEAQQQSSRSSTSSRKREHREADHRDDHNHKEREHSHKDRDHKDSDHGHREKKSRKQDGDRDRRKDRDTNGTSKETAEEVEDSATGPSVGDQMAVLSADKIRLMMVTAQKEIEERKKALSVLKGEEIKPLSIAPNAAAVSAAKAAAAQIKTQIHQIPGSTMPPPGVIKPMLYSQPTTTVFSREDYEKQRRMAELQAKIQSKLSTISATATNAGQIERPKPLILDKDGKLVDQSGRLLQVATLTPTLKANIRAKKREELKSQLVSRGGTLDQEEEAWYDPRVPVRPAVRSKRALRFHEPGKFQQMADRIRMKAQLEKLQNEISQIARKTGISSATKLALLTPDTEDTEEIPELEWWDSVILMTTEEREAAAAKSRIEAGRSALGSTLPSAVNLDDSDDILKNVKEDAITNLVEHPTQLRPPSEPTKPVYMPVFLTKKERKKLRRQTRREAWKEEQEKVRLGLEAPAEPKLRISNLMRVLGSEAVQDPTKIEAHVREQMAKRKRAHEEANAARKLSHEQRTERRVARLKEDTTLGVHIGVYRVRDLFECCAKKFKVEKNAEQLFMTGCVILHRGCCVVITEGGPKQHSKFKRLMQHRIKWDEDTVKDNDGNEIPNSCELVWEGTQVTRCFGDVKFKVCPTERSAREHLAKHRAHHYWDLAYSSTLLSQEE